MNFLVAACSSSRLTQKEITNLWPVMAAMISHSAFRIVRMTILNTTDNTI